MICWYCHWGWPKPVADIFLDAKAELGGNDYPLLYGPAHVVWADENWDCAQGCLDEFERWRGDNSDEDLAIVRRSLEQLAALPADVWDVEPGDYDGKHPENYPPPVGVEMVRIDS